MAKMALQKFVCVPVLIICGSRTEADEFLEFMISAVSRQTSKKELGRERKAIDYVQQLAEYDKDNNEMNWNAIVARATEVFDDIKTRRITVTVQKYLSCIIYLFLQTLS